MEKSIMILIMGARFTGKTELFNRFQGKEFSGKDSGLTSLKFFSIPSAQVNEGFKVSVLDDVAYGLNDRLFHWKDWGDRISGVVFVYDITRMDSFQELEEGISRSEERSQSADFEVIIVGNKFDLVSQREVSTDHGLALAHKYGGTFFEVSAKTNYNVKQAFDAVVKGAVARKKRKMNAIPDEISQDPYALHLYQKALLGGKENDKSIRVNIVGNFRQGKTTLMRRLLGQKIEGIKSTDGIVVEHFNCNRAKDGTFCFTKAETNDADYVKRLVFAAQKEKTNDKNQQSQSTTIVWQENSSEVAAGISANEGSNSYQSEMRQNLDSNTSSDPQISDGVSSKNSVLSSEGKSIFVKSLRANQESPKQDAQMVFDIWDFGGQYVFYATHTIFHSKRAIYLLVFDLSFGLNKCVVDKECPTESEGRDMKYFLQFWMNSIHSFVGSADGYLPKVILVGTHKDKLKGNKQEKERYIKKYFEDVRQLFDGTNLSNHILSDDFAVDNKDAKDASLNALRETIRRVGDEQSNMIEIPLKWIQLEKSLLERKHLKLISIKFVLAIDLENEFPLGDLEQVKLFLRYHHLKGTFVYFDEAPISEHVVLDPQYLIDAFRSIITCERFCTNDPDIRPLWKMLLVTGRLEKQLIDRQ